MLDKHIFAIYSQQLTIAGSSIFCSSTEAFHRVRRVLHLSVGEEVILFDGKTKHECTISGLNDKKEMLNLEVKKSEPITPLAPSITLLCCLTKKEAFEEIAYHAGQLGITALQPVISKKIHRNWLTPKDIIRIEKLIIAGCEQAKQYAIPALLPAIEIHEAAKTDRLLTAEAGHESLVSLCTNKQENYTILIGPEGGFSPEEIALLNNAKTKFFSLTPSILRSQEAVLLAAGIIRTAFK